MLHPIKTAITSISRNKLRAVLTILGIVIGIASVLALSGIGAGSKKNMTDRMAAHGARVISIYSIPDKHGEGTDANPVIRDFFLSDMESISRECRYVDKATPSVEMESRVIHGNYNWQTGITGCNENFHKIYDRKIAQGAFLQKQDIAQSSLSAVIGETVKKELFGNEDPVGKTLRINNVPFKVLGVIKGAGKSGWDDDVDDFVLIPYTTMRKRLRNKRKLNKICVSAISAKDWKKAEKEIRSLLRQRRKLSGRDRDNFEILSNQAWMKGLNKTNNAMSIFLASISSISLLVGGIGIMNIMLVSVSERIKEIGIRMALGAKSRDIMAQFLWESIILSVFGGFAGIPAGIWGCNILSIKSGIKPVFTPESFIVSICVSLSVGIIFGIFPSWKASRLRPVEALYNE